MNALEVAQGKQNRGRIRVAPTAIRETPVLGHEDTGTGRDFVPNTLARDPRPVSEKSEFKRGMICVNL